MARLRGRFGLALAVAVLNGFVLTGPAVAATPITFYIYINSICISGTGQASTDFVVRLFAPNDDLVNRVRTTSNTFGNWTACFNGRVGAGDKVRAVGGGSDRTVTVPNLTMRANRVTDAVTGHWHASTNVFVCATHYVTFELSNTNCLSTTSAGNGDYGVDFTSTFNLRGYDNVGAAYASGGDSFAINIVVPYMLITRADPSVYGYLNRGTSATLSLRDASSVLRGTAEVRSTAYGEFYDSSFMTTDGTLVRPRPTDKVVGTFASDASITIPGITVDGAASTDVVTGHCMPSRPFLLIAQKADVSDSTYRYGATDGSGNFTRDLSADIDLAKWDVLTLTCLYQSGDQIKRNGYVTS